ncbi:MAG: hypothetical protein RIT81_06165 [Deltaproteobacteria bacterium]
MRSSSSALVVAGFVVACGSPSEPTRVYLERADHGAVVSSEEIATATDRYLELLAGTDYFRVTAERTHGVPRNDPEGRYWYGTWWNGVTVFKEDGRVRFFHQSKGSDNNALRTAPLLAGTCFAQNLWGGQEALLRELVRGFNSWSMAMDRGDSRDHALLARVHYVEPVMSTDDGVEVLIDYSENLPGEYFQGELEQPPTIYVHNPDNPHWGDIWIKNKRSKDDVGHMLQAMAYLPACTQSPGADLAEDLELMHTRYGQWARRVEADDWRIATVDEDWETYHPMEQLAAYIQLFDVECTAMLATRLFGHDDPGTVACGTGISELSEVWALKKDFHQIERSFHQAATALAYRGEHVALGDTLVEGLIWRLDTIFDAREAGEYPEKLHDKDLAELVIMAANVGVPLTSREVRFLHGQIEKAWRGYLTEEHRLAYDVFSPDTPDGEYPFNPNADGLFWRYIGALLGQCASPYKNPNGRPVFDCDAVRAR